MRRSVRQAFVHITVRPAPPHSSRADTQSNAASTGVRAGEQWAARWRDVDLETGHLHIGRRVDAYREEGVPKSAAGVRTVPISSQLTAMLKAWKLKSKFKAPDDLIFPNDDGNHTSHDNLVKRRFRPLFDSLEAAYRADRRDFLRRPAALIGTLFGTLPYHAGLRPGSRRRRCRHSLAMLRYK